MIAYIIISFLMMVTPGPGVLSLAGVGAGFGWRVGMMYLIGLFFGTNGVALLVVLGFKQSFKAPKLYEGIFLQFVNPKAYVVQGHLFVVLSLGMTSYNGEILTKFIIVNSIWIPIHLFWLWLGISLKRWSLASNKQVWVNRGMGLSLFAVVILSAVMELNTAV